MTALDKVADAQALWSHTASVWKYRLTLARGGALCCSIAGALFATAASQADPTWHRYLGMLGGLILLGASGISANFLGTSQIQNWLRARTLSEALKREGWAFAVSAKPYDDGARRSVLLDDERERLEREVDDLAGNAIVSPNASSLPRTDQTRARYVEERIRRQVEGFYQPQAHASRNLVRRLRWTELVLSLVAASVAVVVACFGNDFFGKFGKIDFIAFTAVFTTVGGAILAHIEAARYDFVLATYLATARRLRNELTKSPDFEQMSPEDWSDFVHRCEGIIADQNSSWLAKWSKAS